MNPPARLWLWCYQKAKGLEYTRKNGSTSALPLLPIYPKTTTATHTRRVLRLPPTRLTFHENHHDDYDGQTLSEMLDTNPQALAIPHSSVYFTTFTSSKRQKIQTNNKTPKHIYTRTQAQYVHITRFWWSTFPFIYVDPRTMIWTRKGSAHTQVRGERVHRR